MKITRRIRGMLLLSVAALTMTACATQEQTGRLLGGAAGAAGDWQLHRGGADVFGADREFRQKHAPS